MASNNSFKQALADGHPQVGFWASLCSNIACNVIADSGFDFIVIDMEHTVNDLGSVLGQMQALQASDTTTVVRAPWSEAVMVKRLMDMGAHSLLFPFVQSPDEAREAARSMRYPPEGIRGVAVSTRANNYGRDKTYFQRVHGDICLLVQLETQEALSHLEEIAAIDEVDGIFIGPSDLSADFGHLGNPMHQDNLDAIADACARGKAAGKAMGFLTGDIAQAHECFDMGFTFVAVGADVGVLRVGADKLAQEFARHKV
jgi:4-hydroxy-2-oxoheptanedioate aldolase